MAYLIDSDWVIDHLSNIPTAVDLLTRLAREGIAVSIITYMEAYQGILRSSNPVAAEAALEAFVHAVPVLTISQAVARRCAQVKETLRAQGRRVNQRALDLLIAATALEHDLMIVTRNREDYSDIPTLQLYQPN
jgi:predicted nucleic acid-binding protein